MFESGILAETIGKLLNTSWQAVPKTGDLGATVGRAVQSEVSRFLEPEDGTEMGGFVWPTRGVLQASETGNPAKRAVLEALSCLSKPCLGAVAAVELCPRSCRNHSQLTMFHDGVAWATEELQDFPSKYKIWVSSQGLRHDLGHFRVVQDQAYQQLLSRLQSFLQSAWRN